MKDDRSSARAKHTRRTKSKSAIACWWKSKRRAGYFRIQRSTILLSNEKNTTLREWDDQAERLSETTWARGLWARKCTLVPAQKFRFSQWVRLHCRKDECHHKSSSKSFRWRPRCRHKCWTPVVNAQHQEYVFREGKNNAARAPAPPSHDKVQVHATTITCDASKERHNGSLFPKIHFTTLDEATTDILSNLLSRQRDGHEKQDHGWPQLAWENGVFMISSSAVQPSCAKARTRWS